MLLNVSNHNQYAMNEKGPAHKHYVFKFLDAPVFTLWAIFSSSGGTVTLYMFRVSNGSHIGLAVFTIKNSNFTLKNIIT